MACNCHSYNKATGETPEVAIEAPDWLYSEPKTVDLDACIAGAVQALWRARVATYGSCCGHGKRPPSVVIDDGGDAEEAYRVLAQEDGRDWEVYQWRLVLMPSPETATVKVADPGVVELLGVE